MAILTEKEATLEWGLFTAKLYAEFKDGDIDGLWINLYIDGMPVRWHFGNNNQVQLICLGMITLNWERLLALVDQRFSKQLEDKILELIK